MAEKVSAALIIERWYPFVLGLACGALYLAVPTARSYRMPESLAALMGAVVSIGGISVGFLVTAKSILVSIDEKEIVKRLKQAGYYRRIIEYLRDAIRWSFLLTIYSGLCLLVDLKTPHPPASFDWTIYHAWGFAAWIFLSIGSILSYYRVVSIFYAVLDAE